MKKIIFILFILLVGAGVIIFRQRVGDVRRAILPTLKQQIPLNTDLKVEEFATGLEKPRDLEFSPGGTLLVSEPGTGKVVALPNKKDVLIGLQTPHGIDFYKDKLFVAEETKVSRYGWDENNLTATFEKKLFDLPAGGRHSTRSLVFDKDGRLFVTIGSTCDVCFENHPWLTTVIVSDEEGKTPKVFSKGLRNAVFITINPKTNELWGTEMGRDFLGDETPPDEINILKEGKNYGWPVCYGDKIYDKQFGQRSPEYCRNTEIPVYKIAAHSAPLGLHFFKDDLYVAYHGSWNRSTPIGYKVVKMRLDGDKVLGEEDFMASPLERPVDIEDDGENLYISDDKTGKVYKVIF